MKWNMIRGASAALAAIITSLVRRAVAAGLIVLLSEGVLTLLQIAPRGDLRHFGPRYVSPPGCSDVCWLVPR